MIYYVDETVFNTPAEWIVNTVNCVGVMGKGLALEFSLRYPSLKDIYIEQCKKKEIKVGQIYDYNIDGVKIINFPTKYDFKFPSKLEWIEKGLIDFVRKYKSLGIKSIAFPYLGCSNGELDPKKVIIIMEKYLAQKDLDVYICSSKVLNGKEKEMLDNLKKTPIEEICKIAKLNSAQKNEYLKYYDKIDRFYQLLDVPKIGIKSYEKLFRFFYGNNQSIDKKEYVQYSLF